MRFRHGTAIRAVCISVGQSLSRLSRSILEGAWGTRNRGGYLRRMWGEAKKRGELSLRPDFRLFFERCNYSMSREVLRILLR